MAMQIHVDRTSLSAMYLSINFASATVFHLAIDVDFWADCSEASVLHCVWGVATRHWVSAVSLHKLWS